MYIRFFNLTLINPTPPIWWGVFFIDGLNERKGLSGASSLVRSGHLPPRPPRAAPSVSGVVGVARATFATTSSTRALLRYLLFDITSCYRPLGVNDIMSNSANRAL